jgi:hypothetical protein
MVSISKYSFRFFFVPACLVALVLTSAHGVRASDITVDDTTVASLGESLSESDMDARRGSGGTTTTVNVESNQTIASTSTGNTLNVGGSLTNGSITTGNNFGGSGIGSYVMNTGNNSTINSGVSLSVLMMQ